MVAGWADAMSTSAQLPKHALMMATHVIRAIALMIVSPCLRRAMLR
jgi:hypothetical protein